MHPGRPSRITLTSVFAVGVLTLCACGTATSPGPGAASSAKTDPARATTRAASIQPTMPDGGLVCPATIPDGAGMTVPQPPAGVDGAARLLPDRPPSSMVVCAYPVLEISAAPLSPPFAITKRTVASHQQQTTLAYRLSWAPRGGGTPGPCTDMGGDETVYLVGTLFAGSDPAAAIWVAAKADPNSCSPATNGDFVARKGVGNDIGKIVDEVRPSPISSSGDPCVFDSVGGGVGFFGRLGDDRSLAPAGDPSVTVCRPGHGQRGSVLDADQGTQVVAVLRALPTAPSGGVCSVVDSAQDRRQRGFSLVLRYPAGPPSTVNVSPGCRPEVLGLGLQAGGGSAVVKLVEQWSKPVSGLDPNGSVSPGGNTTGGGSAPSGTPAVMTTAVAPQPGTPPKAVPAPARRGGGASGILPQPPRLPNSSTSR